MPEARVIPLDGRDEPRASRARRPQRCSEVGDDGSRCARSVVAEGLCDEHLTQLQQAQAEAAMPDWERKVAGALAFMRRRVTGEYPVDDFGFDPDLTEHVLLAALRPLYEKYFRIETRGLENIPNVGGALLVANHSGTVPIDAMMTQLRSTTTTRRSGICACLVPIWSSAARWSRRSRASPVPRWLATRTRSG